MIAVTSYSHLSSDTYALGAVHACMKRRQDALRDEIAQTAKVLERGRLKNKRKGGCASQNCKKLHGPDDCTQFCIFEPYQLPTKASRVAVNPVRRAFELFK